MRRLGLRPGADLLLGLEHLVELVVLVAVGPDRLAFHALVAGGHELTRILLPDVERLLFFLDRELLVAHQIGRPRVVLRRMLDLVLVRGLVGHQAARFARTGTGTGFGVSAIVGVVSSTIALMKIIGSQNNISMTRTPLRMPAALA